MRNPIERAWSQFVMRLDRSGKRDFGLTRHNKLLRNVEREGSRSRTDYLQALENWATFYPEERIFVGFLEDIHFYPEELLGNVYRFLGVDASFRSQGVGERVHARSAGRMTSDAAVDLAGLYREELSRLSEHFGGYASFWFYCAEQLVASPPRGVRTVPAVGIGDLGRVDSKNSKEAGLPERSPTLGEDRRVKTVVAVVSAQG